MLRNALNADDAECNCAAAVYSVFGRRRRLRWRRRLVRADRGRLLDVLDLRLLAVRPVVGLQEGNKLVRKRQRLLQMHKMARLAHDDHLTAARALLRRLLEQLCAREPRHNQTR